MAVSAAVRDLHPGSFAFVMATGITSADRVFGFFTITAGLDVLGVRFALVILGLWRHVRRHWPLSYEPTLWSAVFPLGMYSVATLVFGETVRLDFMHPIAHVMLWVAVAAWVLVAAGFLARLSGHRQRAAAGTGGTA